jgi:hypothetical protein
LIDDVCCLVFGFRSEEGEVKGPRMLVKLSRTRGIYRTLRLEVGGGRTYSTDSEEDGECVPATVDIEVIFCSFWLDISR